MIASNHRALNVLFPVSQQGANSLPNAGVDMSNCFMVLEKSDFELLQVHLRPCPCLTCSCSPPLSSRECACPHANLVNSAPAVVTYSLSRSGATNLGRRLQPRTLFLRSVDAALECMLIYFGMESTYLYDSEVAGKRLL